MEKRFSHLHVHSPYSLLDGFAKFDEMIDKALKDGMDSIAITDHGVMFGVIEFYKKMKAKGLKPIIGCEVYVANRKRNLKENIDKKSYHLVLLAENNEGYQNLIKLVSIGYTEGFYYKPRVDKEVLKKYSKGIIALSACLAGEVQQYLLSNEYDKAKNTALEYEEIFGKDNFFLEIQDHGIEEQKRIIPFLEKISRETGIDMVVTNDVHYVDKEDNKIHDILLCIQTNKTIYDEHKMEFATEEFYFKTRDEMYRDFAGYEKALNNTQLIADRCNVNFEFGKYHLPEFKVPENTTTEKYLRELAEKGLKKRYKEITKEIRERFEFELSTIINMGFVEYFLIVWDFINFAKTNNIVVGPGRGSAAGSIVAYTLDITDVDPIENNLLFERFLNPDRISMPDVDVDFCYERREKVIDYVKEKYNADHVAQIITFGTLGARAAIRDVGRVLAIPYQEVDKVAKEIPFTANTAMTIDKALEINPLFKKLYDEDEKARELIEISKKVEGLPRHASTHAAGVVIARNSVDTYVPLYMHQNSVTTQFAAPTLEELGLLKMDFLGLRTLTVIQDCLLMIERNYNKKIDLHNLKFDDKKVYELISQGNTLGIFQLESTGMRNFLKELKPEHFEDIVAGISLYRPGPMESIPQYLKNKNNPELITYQHEQLKPILEVTKGVLIYQEQVMQVVRYLAGYSYARADLVRKAMSKKKMDVMEQEREYFVNGKLDANGNIEIAGCVRNGVDAETANEIYDKMIKFAEYAFNKSHAACYGVLAYQTAYLKAHYPVEFMTSLITSVMGNTDKVVQYIRECGNMGIKVLGPDINKSYFSFSVEDGNIRFGLAAVKSIGVEVVKSITKERDENGDYKDFNDFIERTAGKDVNKRLIENLIKCGAFDSILNNRAALLASYEKILDSVNSQKKNNIDGQMNLFGIFQDQVQDENKVDTSISDFNEKQRLSMEKEVLGLYLSGHPLNQYKTLIETSNFTTTSILKEKKENYEQHQYEDNSYTKIAGIIVKKVVKTTRKNEIMLFMTIEDLYGTIEVIVFPKILEESSEYIKEDNPIYIEGRLSLKEDEDVKIVAQKIRSLEQVPNNKKIYLRIERQSDRKTIESIEKIIMLNPGKDSIIFYANDTKVSFISEKYNKINYTKEVYEKLKMILGEKNIKEK